MSVQREDSESKSKEKLRKEKQWRKGAEVYEKVQSRVLKVREEVARASFELGL